MTMYINRTVVPTMGVCDQNERCLIPILYGYHNTEYTHNPGLPSNALTYCSCVVATSWSLSGPKNNPSKHPNAMNDNSTGVKKYDEIAPSPMPEAIPFVIPA